MKQHDVDWAYLTQGFGLRLVLCGLTLLALGASVWFRADYALRSDQPRQQLDALDQQRLELASRLQARAQFAARFAELGAAGIVGEEQRLQWAQVLRDSATVLRLPYLRYSAAPQRPFDAPYLAPGVAAPVMATDMELQVGLVHEEDLLRLISRLRHEAPGLLSVTGCTLERPGGALPPQPDKANITGTCQLRWFSIPLASAAVAMEAGQ